MASKGRKSYDELLRNIFEYIDTVEDKPLNLYMEQIRSALKLTPKDIGLQNSYGTTQIENAISNFDIKVTEKYVTDTISPYLEQRKQAIREGIKQQLISKSKTEGVTLSKTISLLTQKEIDKIFARSKIDVDKKIMEDLNITNPNLLVYNSIKNILENNHPLYSFNEESGKAIEALAKSFDKKKPYDIDSLLKQANIDAILWRKIQDKVVDLQSRTFKKFSSSDIMKIIRGQIEKRNADISGNRFEEDYEKEGIKSYLKTKGYDSFVKDGKLIPGGTNFGIESEVLTEYIKKKGYKYLSYENLNKQYEKVIEQMAQEYRPKIEKQSDKYNALREEKEFIENEFKTAIHNTKDPYVTDVLLSKKYSSSFGGILGDRILKDYEEDPWFDKWYDNNKDIKQEQSEEDLRKNNQKIIDMARENYNKAMKTLKGFVEGQSKKAASDKLPYEANFTGLQDVIEKMISGEYSLEDGKAIITALDDSFRDSLGLMSHGEKNLNTISIQGMGGNDVGYANGKLRSTGFKDSEDFDPNDYEMQQRLSEEAGKVAEETVAETTDTAIEGTEEMIYNSFRSAALSGIELARVKRKEVAKKDLEDFYAGNVPKEEFDTTYEDIDKSVNRVANMVERTTAHRGREFSSMPEQVWEDANALSDILEYADAYSYQIRSRAEAQAMSDGAKYDKSYLSAYISSHPLDEDTQARIIESRKAKDAFLSGKTIKQIIEDGTIGEAIERAIGTLDSKVGNRIYDTYTKADTKSSYTKIINENGDELTISEPSEKANFEGIVANQMTPGASSVNTVTEEYKKEHPDFDTSDIAHLSPAERRQLALIREEEFGGSQPWYSAETTPINVDKLALETEKREQEELSDKLKKEKEVKDKPISDKLRQMAIQRNSPENILKQIQEKEVRLGVLNSKSVLNSTELEELKKLESTIASLKEKITSTAKPYTKNTKLQPYDIVKSSDVEQPTETQDEIEEQEKEKTTSKTKTKKTSSTKKSTKRSKKQTETVLPTDNENNITSTIEDENKEFTEGINAVQKHTAVIQEETVAEQNKINISETLAKMLQEERKAFGDVSSVEQSTNAVEENTAAIKENSEAKRENAETSGVKLSKLDIRKSENFENDHTYYAKSEDGKSEERVMSATQLRDILLGKSNPTLAKDIQHVKEVASTLGEGQTLTADMVGAKEGDFNFLKNIIGSGLKGDIFHEIVDGIYKYNAGHQDDMISSLEELKGRDDEAYERLTKSFNKTKAELAKYGFEEDYLTTHSDIAAYMEAIQKMGLKPTGFSEKALGFTLSGSQGAFKVAVTPDQLYSGELGPVLMDNKTGSVKGFESFQLMAQLLGLKANSDLSELEGLDLDKTELTINDVKNGFSQILKYSELTKEQFYDLLVRAQKILDGTASPLDKEEVAKYSTQQKTGIITGGTKQEYVNPVEQNALMSQVVKNQKAKNQVTEQIDLLTKKANDPSRLKAETQSYLEQIKLLQQKLALLEKTQFVLNQEGNLVKLVNGEEVKNISLNEEQQIQLKEQLALLENQHKTVMAKNAGYTNKNQRGFFGAVFGQIKQTFEYLTRTSIVYGVIGKIQSTFSTLIQTVQSLDKAMVDLQIATNTTRSELQEATKDYNSIATEMGRTTQEVMTAANDWLRAGYKTKEANELIRDSMKLSTLGMIDSAKATEYLISTMKGWKLQAEEVSGVVDDLTALDMEFATSAGDIAQAMAKANVSASLAGVDRKTYESMLTAVMDVGQQGADVVGTA